MNKIIMSSLIVLALVSGCLGVETKKPSVEIVSHGNLSIEGGDFSYDATIETSRARTNEEFSFKEVNLSLYGEDKSKIKSVRVGTVSTSQDRPANVKMKSDIIPKYVVIESPEFWALPNVEVKIIGLKWIDSESKYREYFITSESGKFGSE